MRTSHTLRGAAWGVSSIAKSLLYSVSADYFEKDELGNGIGVKGANFETHTNVNDSKNVAGQTSVTAQLALQSKFTVCLYFDI